jgi:hypothetical protein
VNEADLKRARAEPSAIGDQLLKRQCGCFYCLAMFAASEIEEWIDYDEASGIRLTPLCPHCGIDAVVEEAPSRTVTIELLTAMKSDRFG